MREEWIPLYGKRLYGLCVRLCGSQNDADDLYQETWLRVCCHEDRYDASLPPEHWLNAICVNAWRDMCRRDKWRMRLAVFADSEQKDKALEDVPAEQHDSENAELWDAIRRLPPKYTAVIVLHYFRGYGVRELSRILKVPEGTVKYRLFRARELLKGELTS